MGALYALLYIPTRYPDSLPDGASTDHFGRLQSQQALQHDGEVVASISKALAATCTGLKLTKS